MLSMCLVSLMFAPKPLPCSTSIAPSRYRPGFLYLLNSRIRHRTVTVETRTIGGMAKSFDRNYDDPSSGRDDLESGAARKRGRVSEMKFTPFEALSVRRLCFDRIKTMLNSFHFLYRRTPIRVVPRAYRDPTTLLNLKVPPRRTVW